MTSGRKDGMKEQGKPDGALTVEAARRAVNEAVEAVLERVGASWGAVTVVTALDLMRNAVLRLRHYVRKGKGGITWKRPFVELQYDVEVHDPNVEPPPEDAVAEVTPEQVQALTEKVARSLFSDFVPAQVMRHLTRDVIAAPSPGTVDRFDLHAPSEDVAAEINALPESEREAKLQELVAGFEFPGLSASGTADTPEGKQSFTVALLFAIRPLRYIPKTGRAFFPIQVGLDFTEGDPTTWPEDAQREELWTFFLKAIEDLAAPFVAELEPAEKKRRAIPEPDRAVSIRPEAFPVAGGYVRPMYGLAKRKQDFPRLLEYHERQTPLNWAVGLALFSLTDEDKVRSRDWQEARIRDIEDRVFCLTELDAPARGDHRSDILAEVVKLHTTRNWYYEIGTVPVGRAWRTQATIGSRYAIPELELVFLNRKTGERGFPTDADLRALQIPLQVKGRRVQKPDGKDIPALPPDRWKLEAVRWRWVQTFNDDLLIAPALVERGKRTGLPKKTTTGKTLRKGYLIRVASNVFDALRKLRAEGGRSLYAQRLLVMLAHELNKTEDGILADRLFRMLGIPDDYEARTHEKREDLVARAIVRLMEKDIGALLPRSDTTPRTDPNPDRRRGPYYRLIRSAAYTPRAGITSKADAQAIEATYSVAPNKTTPRQPAGQRADQAVLPGMEAASSPPIPSGPEVRAAREAAGLTLRRFAEAIEGGPDFSTWSRYERGGTIRVGPETWSRVRAFVDQHGPKAGPDAGRGTT